MEISFDFASRRLTPLTTRPRLGALSNQAQSTAWRHNNAKEHGNRQPFREAFWTALGGNGLDVADSPLSSRGGGTLRRYGGAQRGREDARWRHPARRHLPA